MVVLVVSQQARTGEGGKRRGTAVSKESLRAGGLPGLT